MLLRFLANGMALRVDLAAWRSCTWQCDGLGDLIFFDHGPPRKKNESGPKGSSRGLRHGLREQRELRQAEAEAQSPQAPQRAETEAPAPQRTETEAQSPQAPRRTETKTLQNRRGRSRLSCRTSRTRSFSSSGR